MTLEPIPDGRRARVRLLAGLIALTLLLTLVVAGIGLASAQDPQQEYMRFTAPSHMDHGAELSYTVEHIYFDSEAGRNVSEDVTDSAVVLSSDPSVVSVNAANQTLVATNDTSINERVQVTAIYGGAESTKSVTVSSIELAHLDILPTEYRFQALFSDNAFQVLLVAIGFGIVATRASTAFGGLAMSQMVLAAAWFGGWVPTSIVLIGLFLAMFIGFNLAANIDYTVRR